MQLGPKISGVESAFLSMWRCGYSFNCSLWRTSVIKYKSPRMALLIFAPQVNPNVKCWRTPDLRSNRRTTGMSFHGMHPCLKGALRHCLSIFVFLSWTSHIIFFFHCRVEDDDSLYQKMEYWKTIGLKIKNSNLDATL